MLNKQSEGYRQKRELNRHRHRRSHREDDISISDEEAEDDEISADEEENEKGGHKDGQQRKVTGSLKVESRVERSSSPIPPQEQSGRPGAEKERELHQMRKERVAQKMRQIGWHVAPAPSPPIHLSTHQQHQLSTHQHQLSTHQHHHSSHSSHRDDKAERESNTSEKGGEIEGVGVGKEMGQLSLAALGDGQEFSDAEIDTGHAESRGMLDINPIKYRAAGWSATERRQSLSDFGDEKAVMERIRELHGDRGEQRGRATKPESLSKKKLQQISIGAWDIQENQAEGDFGLEKQNSLDTGAETEGGRKQQADRQSIGSSSKDKDYNLAGAQPDPDLDGPHNRHQRAQRRGGRPQESRPPRHGSHQMSSPRLMDRGRNGPSRSQGSHYSQQQHRRWDDKARATQEIEGLVLRPDGRPMFDETPKKLLLAPNVLVEVGLCSRWGTAHKASKVGHEDRAIGPCIINGVGLFSALLDGHRGEQCATFVQEQLLEQVKQSIDRAFGSRLEVIDKSNSNEAIHSGQEGDSMRSWWPEGLNNVTLRRLKDAIAVGCEAVERAWMIRSCHAGINAGSTALVTLLVGEKSLNTSHLVVANLGDSRALLCRAGKPVALTEDHKPTRKDEAVRVKEAGGHIIVSSRGLTRIAHNRIAAGLETNTQANYKLGLSVSRAFGDRDFKTPHELVCPVPEFQIKKLENDDMFLLAACDGVWDVLSNQEVINVAAAHLLLHDASGAAKAVVEAAQKRGSGDDLTVQLTVFQQNKDRIMELMS